MPAMVVPSRSSDTEQCHIAMKLQCGHCRAVSSLFSFRLPLPESLWEALFSHERCQYFGGGKRDHRSVSTVAIPMLSCSKSLCILPLLFLIWSQPQNLLPILRLALSIWRGRRVMLALYCDKNAFHRVKARVLFYSASSFTRHIARSSRMKANPHLQ